MASGISATVRPSGTVNATESTGSGSPSSTWTTSQAAMFSLQEVVAGEEPLDALPPHVPAEHLGVLDDPLVGEEAGDGVDRRAAGHGEAHLGADLAAGIELAADVDEHAAEGQEHHEGEDAQQEQHPLEPAALAWRVLVLVLVVVPVAAVATLDVGVVVALVVRSSRRRRTRRRRRPRRRRQPRRSRRPGRRGGRPARRGAVGGGCRPARAGGSSESVLLSSGVEPGLEQHHGCLLVDDLSAAATVDARSPELLVGGDGAEAFILGHDGHREHVTEGLDLGEGDRPRPCPRSRRGPAAGPRRRSRPRTRPRSRPAGGGPPGGRGCSRGW